MNILLLLAIFEKGFLENISEFVMLIKIDHIEKMEGHAGFMASVLEGDVLSARIEVQEGARLIEGILIGRNYRDMPIIAQRICGICPVVHNLTAIKSLEKALDIKVSPETKKLREVLELGQIIHSHGLHLFFLSLADFLNIDNDIDLVKKYPKEAKMAIKIREYGMEIVKVIGGRVIHPLANEVGGFKKISEVAALQRLIRISYEVLDTSLELGEFFKKINFPDFRRKTEYVSLSQKGRYAIYDGDLVSSQDLHLSVEKFENDFYELQKPREVVKRTSHHGESYMVGAIARINNNKNQLRPQAYKYLNSLGWKFPTHNPFYNILAQMTEVIHSIEDSAQLIKELLNANLNEALTKEYSVKAGLGAAAMEAPRGTLYYHVEVDNRGYIKNVNIITPTAQFLSNLEEDVAYYIPRITKLSDAEKKKKLRAFIRAYDPCISCAVH